MLVYLARRVALAVPTLLLVAAAVFVLIRMIPGDPAQLLLGDATDAAQLAELRRSMGLDQPIVVQFGLWLGRALQGDLGKSITNQLPVLPLVIDRFMVSATIVLVAVAIAAAIAVPLGMIAAARQNKGLDFAVVSMATLCMSVPSFWLGLILLLVFGLKLGWLPVIGYVPFAQSFWGAVASVTLPIATLAIIETGLLARMARASTIEVLRLEYITHARAKGVPEATVLRRHALPNAFAPTWTLIGLVLGNLLGGIAVIETVFTLPGLGRLLVDSIYGRDYPVVQGCLLFTAAIYVAVNLVVDALYPFFDPRVTAQ
jgi:peptide/nickel transport system permease protein